MPLDAKTRADLLAASHALKPLVQLADEGLSASAVAQVERTLQHHELLKIRLQSKDREANDATAADLAKRTGSQLVARIGRVALLYRPRA